MKKIIEIQQVTDDMDCETCGGNYAVGWRVGITWDSSLSFNLEPFASCYGGNDYDFSVAYNRLRDVIPFLPEATDGYMCAEELAPELGHYREVRSNIFGVNRVYDEFYLNDECEFAHNDIDLLRYLLDRGAPGVYEVKILDNDYIGDLYSSDEDYDD